MIFYLTRVGLVNALAEPWVARDHGSASIWAYSRRGLIEYESLCGRALAVREPRPTNLLSSFPEIVHQAEDLLPGLEHLGDPLVDREREFAF